MGFMEAGFDIVFANEYDKVFADLHDEGIREWCIGHPKITSSNAARPQIAVNAENTQTILVSDQPHISK